MDFNELKRKYASLPQEMQLMRHWVCYRTEIRDGKDTKVPVNAITGDYAKSNDPSTWTTFSTACRGVEKYGLEGIGFMFGAGIFGIDLDNHPDQVTGEYAMSEEEFKKFSEEFISQLNSYTEWSRSKKGIHIICKGKLPEGRRRNGCVEMYEKGRFFACTGYTINPMPVMDRTNEIIPLWKKYVDDSERRKEIEARRMASPLGISLGTGSGLTDAEVFDKASHSANGRAFVDLYNGKMSSYDNDHSKADMAFCSMLAFWCNGDKQQMDRIFRSSALMREKWDSFRGSETYGEITLNSSLATMTDGYKKQSDNGIIMPTIVKNTTFASKEKKEEKDEKEAGFAEISEESFMNIDKDGEPIFRLKNVYKSYPYTDTGNAERFYDQFGDLFKYNVDAKTWMFWTGKTWIFDNKCIIRKYANKLLDLMKDDVERLKENLKRMTDDDSDERMKALKKTISKAEANIDKVANKNGKDNMLAELQSIHDIPASQGEFDSDIYLLNANNGTIDLKTGNILPFDKTRKLSKNTNVNVSYEEPKVWLKFISDIFKRGNDEKAAAETKEIIDCIQMALGLSLTGDTREQTMFLLYGSGSNGKSTLMELLAYILGDYCQTIDSEMLMSKASQNTSVQFSLAELPGCRLLITKETNEGDKLAEGTIKALTGSDQINAQKKYGRPFQFLPQFKLWMMTNNLPVIRGTDKGIWRRIFLVPFERSFEESEKDLDMPNKLRAEADRILGWCVQGYKHYLEQGGKLKRPQCLQMALQAYKGDMDVVSRFIDRFCRTDKDNDYLCIERQTLYNSFSAYARSNNEFPLREPKFFRNMVDSKGMRCIKHADGNWYYHGICLTSSGVNLTSNKGDYHGTLFNDD